LITSYKHEYQYNANGKISQEISYNWDKITEKWEASWKSEISYNSNGDETSSIDYSWDEYSNQWSANWKSEYNYNSQGKQSSAIYFYYNNQAWNFEGKEEFTYDLHGYLIQRLEYDVNNNNQWIQDDKDVFVYDDKGNNTQAFYYNNWDIQTNKWDDIYKEEYSFDNTYSYNDLILPFYFDVNTIFAHMITEFNGYYWDNIANEWISGEKATFAYSPINITAIENIRENELKAYPNPATDFVVFELKNASQPATIEIIDIRGKKVVSQVLPDNRHIAVSQLKSGLYFYTVSQNERIYRGKVVVK
jgi:hypothetical protein